MSLSQLAGAWDASPFMLAAAAVAAVRFVHGFRRLRRRGRSDLAGWNRALLFGAGLALITLPLVSPLDAAGDRDLLSAHMLEHVLLGDAGPAFTLVALRGPLLAFVLPAGLVGLLNRRRVPHAVAGWLARPSTALVLWALAIGIWHVPHFYDAALGRPWLHDLEHATFLAAGLLAWAVLVDPARRGRLSVGGRIAFAGALFAFGQLLTAVLFLAPSPLYPAYAAQEVRLFGLTPLADQQYAGLVMMAEQLATLGTCVALLLAASFRGSGRPARLATT
jgi:cytochrome c oxidase assembly factor CtaG